MTSSPSRMDRSAPSSPSHLRVDLSSPHIDPIDATDPELMSLSGNALYHSHRHRSKTHDIGYETTLPTTQRRRSRTTIHHFSSSTTELPFDQDTERKSGCITSLLLDEPQSQDAKVSAPSSAFSPTVPAQAVEDVDTSRQSRSVSFGTPVSLQFSSFGDGHHDDMKTDDSLSTGASSFSSRDPAAASLGRIARSSSLLAKRPAASTPIRKSVDQTEADQSLPATVDRVPAVSPQDEMLRPRRVTVGSEARTKADDKPQEGHSVVTESRDLQKTVLELQGQLDAANARNAALERKVSDLSQAVQQLLPDSPQSMLRSFSNSAMPPHNDSPFNVSLSAFPISRTAERPSPVQFAGGLDHSPQPSHNRPVLSSSVPTFSPFSPTFPSFQHRNDSPSDFDIMNAGLGFLDSPGIPGEHSSWPTPPSPIGPTALPLPRPALAHTAISIHTPGTAGLCDDRLNSMSLYLSRQSGPIDAVESLVRQTHVSSNSGATPGMPSIKPSTASAYTVGNKTACADSTNRSMSYGSSLPTPTISIPPGLSSKRRSPSPLRGLAGSSSSTGSAAPPLHRSTSDRLPSPHSLDSNSSTESLKVQKKLNRLKFTGENAFAAKVMVRRILSSRSPDVSMMLQNELKSSSPARKLEILDAVKLFIVELADDKHGNFLLQRAIDFDPSMVWALRGRFNQLAVSQFGCHVILRILNEEEGIRCRIVEELLAGDIKETLRSRHSIHVWQKILELDWSHRDFRRTLLEVINATMRGSWAETAMMETGSIICQNIFESTEAIEKKHCLDEILARVSECAASHWGVWVVQHIIEHGDEQARRRALDALIPDSVALTLSASGQKAIMSALKTGDAKFLGDYLDVLCERDVRPTMGSSAPRRSPLVEVASSPQGLQIITQLVTTVNTEQRDRIIATVRKNSVFLKGSRPGLKVHQLCERARAYTGY